MRWLRRVAGFPTPVYVVVAGRFVNVFGRGVVYPFASLYFHLVVGIPLSLVGTGLLALRVGSATGTLLGGVAADRYGRKPVMVASMALAAPALAAYALVGTAAGFVAVSTAAGLSMGLLPPASQALVADLTAEADRERAYGLLKVGSNAGFGAGFVAGGLLYGVAKTAVFLVDGATCAVAAAVFAVALPWGARQEDSPGVRETAASWVDAVGDPTLAALAALNVGFAVMYAQMQATVPVWAETQLGLTSEQLGTLYVLNPLVIVVFQLPIVDRVTGWRRTRGLVLSAGFWAASFVAVAAVPAAPLLVGLAPAALPAASWLLGVALVGAFLVLRTVGEILHSPLMTALTSDLGAAHERGSQLSVLEVAKQLGFGVGGVVGGVFFDAGAAGPLWATLLVGCGLLAAGLLAVERRVTPAVNAGAAAAD